ncbi:MAG TPA: HEAT repeat domain-containing protein [Candidatus Saccharimonadales bacterium]|nr:HEAT repeat domain-containing protein [Candidatus Saccharimonadales bacterium]
MSTETPYLCKEVSELLMFYVCGEVSEQERAAIDQHLALCERCKAELAAEVEFQNVLHSLPPAAEQLDPSGILLGQCRSELEERIDDMAHPPKEAHGVGWLRRWMALHPAWSAATLVLFGLVAGVESTQWFTGRDNANALDVVNVRPSGPHLTEDQLSKMAVAGVNFLPPSNNAGSKTVRVQLSAEQPVELSGTVDDSDVRSVLTYVVRNGDRFDSGVRLDCLEALKALAEDTQVRAALLSAARKDQNPAVRLKALEALRETTANAEVRETLLQALQHDSNPGVRVEAVNLLVRSIETGPRGVIVASGMPVPEIPQGDLVPANAGAPASDSMLYVIRALEELQHKDPSQYVRMRSAAALREINIRDEQ